MLLFGREIDSVPDSRTVAEFVFRHFRSIFFLISCLSLLIVFGIVDWGNRINDRVEVVQEQVSLYASEFPIKGSSEGQLRRKIWQTAHNGSKTIDSELVANYLSWHRLNPLWEYELLNEERADRYIESRFMLQDNGIVDVFTEIKNNMVRVNLFRYLVLLADGGLYSDVDAECLKPIDEWIPDEYKRKANVVVGVQYDHPDADGGNPQVQLATWTILSQKGHDIMRLVVQRAMESIRKLAESQGARPRTLNMTFEEAMASTGPALFTQCVWDYLSKKTRRDFGAKEVSGMDQPKLVGDVLLLPPAAFGSGSKYSSSNTTNESALVHHQFRGLWDEWKDKDQTTREEDIEFLGGMPEVEAAAELDPRGKERAGEDGKG